MLTEFDEPEFNETNVSILERYILITSSSLTMRIFGFSKIQFFSILMLKSTWRYNVNLWRELISKFANCLQFVKKEVTIEHVLKTLFFQAHYLILLSAEKYTPNSSQLFRRKRKI